jgi:hypothetical protein
MARFQDIMRVSAYLVETPRNAILYNGIVEVTGSIPVGSTKSSKGLADPTASPFSFPEAPRTPVVSSRYDLGRLRYGRGADTRYFARASRMARQTRSEVAGMST